LGYPFSVSPSFQLRNTNMSQEEAFRLVETLQEKVEQKNKNLVVYLSMGFGNPYGDPYHPELLLEWADRIQALGVKRISLADTVGLASPTDIESALTALVPAFPAVHIGVHLHAQKENRTEKLAAALRGGAQSVDGAIGGFGGCPMAQDELVGNLDTLWLAQEWRNRFAEQKLSWSHLMTCQAMATQIFSPE
jgi:hydroxymethylglutaryl-CoA lyase